MPRKDADEEPQEEAGPSEPPPQSKGKTGKFRKEKPWDVDGIDHWCALPTVGGWLGG